MHDRPLSWLIRVRVSFGRDCYPCSSTHGYIPSHPWIFRGPFPDIVVYFCSALGLPVSPHTLPNSIKYNGRIKLHSRTVIPVVLSETAQQQGRRGLFKYRRSPRRKVLTSLMFAAGHEALQRWAPPLLRFTKTPVGEVSCIVDSLRQRDRLYDRAVDCEAVCVRKGARMSWLPRSQVLEALDPQTVARTGAVATTRPHPQEGSIWL